MPRRCIPMVMVLFILLTLSFWVFGMDWPDPAATLLMNFGWNYRGKPVLGNSFVSDGPIRASEGGELLFVHQEGDTASHLPSPLGSWMALDHGGGLISVYGRLDDGALSYLPNTVEKERIIAQAGQSGWSNRRGFYFSLFDRKERRWINPSMIITSLADIQAPVIQGVELRTAEGRTVNPAQVRSISQGRYTISVQTQDTLKDLTENPLAPFRILCSVNGLEIGALTFETYSARDGVLMVYRNGLVPVKQVYAPFPAFEVGEVLLTRGQATLEIISQDFAGNSYNVTFRLQVE